MVELGKPWGPRALSVSFMADYRICQILLHNYDVGVLNFQSIPIGSYFRIPFLAQSLFSFLSSFFLQLFLRFLLRHTFPGGEISLDDGMFEYLQQHKCCYFTWTSTSEIKPISIKLEIFTEKIKRDNGSHWIVSRVIAGGVSLFLFFSFR